MRAELIRQALASGDTTLAPDGQLVSAPVDRAQALAERKNPPLGWRWF